MFYEYFIFCRFTSLFCKLQNAGRAEFITGLQINERSRTEFALI
jgi:hypothetical protein